MQQVVGTSEALRAAVEQGDLTLAAAVAAALAPDMAAQLDQFRIQMEIYEEAWAVQDMRRALRALADARIAAIAAGFPELETVASDRLYEVVKKHEGRRHA